MQNINAIGGGPRFPLSPQIKSYSVVLWQIAHDPPFALTTIKDEIGFPKTWTKTANGIYYNESTNDWPNWIPYTNGYYFNGSNTRLSELTNDITGQFFTQIALTKSGNKIRIDLNVNFAGADISELGQLKLPEIRIYKL